MCIDTSYFKRQCKTKRFCIETKMEYNDVDLENICQEKLGWPAHKVARTRPVDMRAAIAEFDEEECIKETAIVTNSNEDLEQNLVLIEPVRDDTTIPLMPLTLGVEMETPNVMLFSRRKLCAEYANTTPLLTPMPTNSVTAMRPFMVAPSPMHLNKVINSPLLDSGSKSDIDISIDRLIRRQAKFTKQLQEKRDLMQSLHLEMDLEDTLVLDTSIKYSTNRLHRTIASIMELKTKIKRSIDRKKKLLAVSTESDDEDDKEENLDESDKRSEIDHIQRAATMLAKIDALESAFDRLDV